MKTHFLTYLIYKDKIWGGKEDPFLSVKISVYCFRGRVEIQKKNIDPF